MNVIHHEIGRDSLYKTWHAAKSCMIIYFYTDGGSVVFQNQMYPIQSGSLCFIRAGQQHYTLPDKPESYDRSKIFLSEQRMDQVLSVLGTEPRLHRMFEDSSAIYAPIPTEYRDEVEQIYQRAAQSLQGSADESRFLCCFLQLMLFVRDFSTEHIDNAKDNLTRAIDFINRHYTADMTLDDVCREVYISKYYLCRRFKRAMGMTVMEYVLKTRIAAAKNALCDGTDSVGEISERCGFSSISYFSQIFKKHTGLTPNQYRKQFSKEK